MSDLQNDVVVGQSGHPDDHNELHDLVRDLQQGVTKSNLRSTDVAEGDLSRVTDDVRGLWMYQGSQWFSLSGEVVNVKEFGAVGDGSNDDTVAVQAAIDVIEALGGGVVLFPPGDYRCTSDLTIESDHVHLVGLGYNSHIQMEGGAVLVDAITAGANIVGFRIRDLRVSRAGTVGPAVHLLGTQVSGSPSTSPIRWTIDNLWVNSSTGDGLLLEATYLGDIIAPQLHGADDAGLRIKVNGTANLSANAIGVYGGRIQSNNIGVITEHVDGLSVFKTTIEGNTVRGVDINTNARTVGFWGCRFEGNGTTSDFDIRIGSGASTGNSHSFTIQGCYFNSSGIDKAILLLVAEEVSITDCEFVGYNTAPIRVSESASAAVQGTWARCVHHSGSTSDVVALNGAHSFAPRGGEENQLTFTDGDATPSVAQGLNFQTSNSAATTVTNFDGGVQGKVITVLFGDGNTTLQDASGGSSIELSGGANHTPTSNDVMQFYHNGTKWFEISRSAN